MDISKLTIGEAREIASRLAAVEAERDALSKDRDSWKVMAECLDVKVLHEQIDHNKTIDGPLALARAERDALRATVVKMREALNAIEGVQNSPALVKWTDEYNTAIAKTHEALSLVPSDLAECVVVKRSEWEKLNNDLLNALPGD